jgi:hypothetical protein
MSGGCERQLSAQMPGAPMFGDVPGQTRRSATATCPKGQTLAFGGFVAPLTYGDEFVQIDSALRASGRAWTARALNTSHSSTAGTLRSLAYCRSRR